MYLDYTDKGEIYRYHDKNKRLDNIECTCFFDLQKNKLVYTLQEIANIFGVTKERVRQIQAEALKKLSSRQEARKHNEM
jgi:DNA-directed RNA polymerase sigma subunit (sigma70/sigma32)